MIFFWIILGQFCLSVADKNNIDWCNNQELSCRGEKHTICEYRCVINKSVQGCKKSKAMTKEVKNKLLKAHNQLRNKIALGEDDQVPENKRKAANMMALSYDNLIEHTAGCWINQCTFAHDKCRNIPKMFVGQNLGIHSSSGDGTCTEAVLLKMIENGWYASEIGMLTSNPDVYGKFQSAGWGHYTQVIWANTKLLGCAATEYISPENGMQSCLLGCNYGPAGNMLGSEIYQVGDPASKCPGGLQPNPTYKGLCGEIKEYGGGEGSDSQGGNNNTQGGGDESPNSGMKLDSIRLMLIFSCAVKFFA